MKHNVPVSNDTCSLYEVLKNTPCLKYWRRLFKKALSDIDLRQEEIALLGYFKAYTPKECSQKFNISLGYVYKLDRKSVV